MNPNDGTGEFVIKELSPYGLCKNCDKGKIYLDPEFRHWKVNYYTCCCCHGNWQDCPNCREVSDGD